jgi:phytoene dehydrogenase-like protein
MNPTRAGRDVDVDVAVVGAGIAGLVTARELIEQGRSVVVLESADHVGGRIQTEHKPGMYLEHGGIFHTHGYRHLRPRADSTRPSVMTGPGAMSTTAR